MGFYRIALAILLTAWVLIPEAAYSWLVAGQPAPDFSMEDVNGQVYTLSDMKDGRLAILYFCDLESESNRAGLRSLNQLARQYQNEGITLWAVTLTPRETVAGFVAESKPDFPILLDISGVSDFYEAIRVLPMAYVIESGRKVLNSFQGGGKTTELQVADFVETTRTMLAKETPSVPNSTGEPTSPEPPTTHARFRPPPPTNRPPPPPEELPKDTAKTLFDLAQKENQKLKWNACLARKALTRAKDLVQLGYFEHKDPKTGKNPAWKLISSCRKVAYGGENLIKSQGEGAVPIHNALMQSNSHRENILNPKFNMLGVGCYKTICVELFAGT